MEAEPDVDSTTDNNKPFKIKDVTRQIKKALVAATLEEMRTKVAQKFERPDQLPKITLDSDGTEIDDEEYFRTLEPNAELIAVFAGENWIDATQYVTIASERRTSDATDTSSSSTSEADRIRKLVGQIQNNLCNVSVMNDPDLDSLSNMDPNSLVDLTGKDFMDQLKETSGRPCSGVRAVTNGANLLKVLKEVKVVFSHQYQPDSDEDQSLEKQSS